jgi:hypothetical protein
LGIAARSCDGGAEDVNEQQREDHRLDGDVGKPQRLAGDVGQVAAGQHDHVDEVEHSRLRRPDEAFEQV